MAGLSLEQIMEEDHKALEPFVRGDPEPKKSLYSQKDDATLANPIGPPARGFTEISATLDRAATLSRDGEVRGFERISEYATEDLAYILEIERTLVRVGDATEPAPISLRVTTIFRREDESWKVVHRHADPITQPRDVTTVLEQ